MIVVDISEHRSVIEALEKRLGKDGFKIEKIGCLDCVKHLFPAEVFGCLKVEEVQMIMEMKEININKDLCKTCDNRRYVRFADFTNEAHSFYYERKTVFDFISSRRDRLYSQLNRMDAFIEGRKGLILEGMSDFVVLADAYYNKPIDKKELSKLSPIQQVIHLAQKPEWTWSFIRELKMRDMEFVQTWNLDETISFLVQCDEGYDHTPKERLIPKRYPDISIDRNILALFDGIGKVRSKKILAEHKDIKDLLKKLKLKVHTLGYGGSD